MFWYELTQGAYGTVQRAKGIFDVTDGRSLYFDFVAGLSKTTYLELNLPPGYTSASDWRWQYWPHSRTGNLHPLQSQHQSG